MEITPSPAMTTLRKTSHQAIRSVEYIGSTTFTDKALSLALQVFTPGSYGARANERHVAIVLTDGLSTDRNKTVTEALRLRNANVTILGIRIGQYDIQELIGITGSEKKIFSAESYSVIHNLADDITKAICKPDYSNYCREMMWTDGLHAHPRDCKQFIVCRSLGTFISACPNGLAFDPALKICDFDDHASLCTNSV